MEKTRAAPHRGMSRACIDGRGWRENAASAQVVQAYITYDDAPLSTPYRQLVAFERVHTRSGEARTIELVVPPARLALVDDSKAVGGKLPVWMATPLTARLAVGGQQPDQPIASPSNVLSAPLVVHGESRPLEAC
jgi:hypothetical protein